MIESPTGAQLRVLVLFSDTGGGHRSAAEALIEAWQAEHPGRVAADMVDVFRGYTPFPFNRFGPSYPWVVRHCGRAYAAVFHRSDSPRRARAVMRAVYGYVRPHLLRLLTDHADADLIVSVHPLFNHCVNWALRELRMRRPYVTVVTDLCTAHAFWFYPHVTRILVPTEEARRRGLACGVSDGRIAVRGLPVARRFTEGLRRVGDRGQVRERLGLSRRGRVVLMIGGGDGMGPLYETARAVEAATADLAEPLQLAVIAGRNAALRERLLAAPWRIPCRIEGFVRNMPEWMAAADVLVTKAGPGTITEGLLSGLPLVLMGKVPGQEDGNVDYVVAGGAGAWEPRPAQAAARLRDWLTPGNPALARMSERARELAYPDAASDIAADILDVAERSQRPELALT
jgi:1,2-diacylglycerol 3-beta-galactosyltransferase